LRLLPLRYLVWEWVGGVADWGLIQGCKARCKLQEERQGKSSKSSKSSVGSAAIWQLAVSQQPGELVIDREQPMQRGLCCSLFQMKSLVTFAVPRLVLIGVEAPGLRDRTSDKEKVRKDSS
jgi:hypothetical protein